MGRFKIRSLTLSSPRGGEAACTVSMDPEEIKRHDCALAVENVKKELAREQQQRQREQKQKQEWEQQQSVAIKWRSDRGPAAGSSRPRDPVRRRHASAGLDLEGSCGNNTAERCPEEPRRPGNEDEKEQRCKNKVKKDTEKYGSHLALIMNKQTSDYPEFDHYVENFDGSFSPEWTWDQPTRRRSSTPSSPRDVSPRRRSSEASSQSEAMRALQEIGERLKECDDELEEEIPSWRKGLPGKGELRRSMRRLLKAIVRILELLKLTIASCEIIEKVMRLGADLNNIALTGGKDEVLGGMQGIRKELRASYKLLEKEKNSKA